MCKIELKPTSSQKKANAAMKGYPRPPSSAIERHKTHQSSKDSCCQRTSSSNDIRNNQSSPKHTQIHDRHISTASAGKAATFIHGCSCKDKTATIGLQGNNLRAFFKVWSMKDTGKHALKHRVLEPPAAWKRSDEYRSCGCATRSHLSSLGLQSVNQCRCGKVRMSPN